jgi:hypothetical protein
MPGPYGHFTRPLHTGHSVGCFKSKQPVSFWNNPQVLPGPCPPLAPHSPALLCMARELLREWRQRVATNTQGAASRLSRNHLAALTSVTAKQGVIDMSRVKTMLPVFGGLLYVVLSVLFGSLWYAVLSMMVTRMAP